MLKHSTSMFILTLSLIAAPAWAQTTAEVKEDAASAQEALDNEIAGHEQEEGKIAENVPEEGEEEAPQEAESAEAAPAAESAAISEASAEENHNAENAAFTAPAGSGNKPGKLAYHPGIATGISAGALFLGVITPAALILASQITFAAGIAGYAVVGGVAKDASIINEGIGLLSKNKKIGALFYTGLVLMGATLGFAPVLGQFLALGKGAKYAFIMAITRTIVSMALPFLSGLVICAKEKAMDKASFLIATNFALYFVVPLMAVWGIVDIALTPKILKKAVKKYEGDNKKIGDLKMAPFIMENGGGIMLGARF